MNYYLNLCYLFGYHIIFIGLVVYGILRSEKINPWYLLAIGFVLQFILDMKYSGTGHILGCFVYFAVITYLFAGIIKLLGITAFRK